MSITANYVRVDPDHIELLQKDLIDAWYDLNPNADYPDRYPTVSDILYDLSGDVEILNLNDWEALSWLLREERRRRASGQLVEQDSWPAVDLPLGAIEGRSTQLSVPAVDFGLGEGAAFDSTAVQKISTALSQITPDDLLRNFDYDAMQRVNLSGFGPLKEEERATEERLARECVGGEFQKLQEFYRRAAASGQYVIIGFA